MLAEFAGTLTVGVKKENKNDLIEMIFQHSKVSRNNTGPGCFPRWDIYIYLFILDMASK